MVTVSTHVLEMIGPMLIVTVYGAKDIPSYNPAGSSKQQIMALSSSNLLP
jgi:hypothetical protein